MVAALATPNNAVPAPPATPSPATSASTMPTTSEAPTNRARVEVLDERGAPVGGASVVPIVSSATGVPSRAVVLTGTDGSATLDTTMLSAVDVRRNGFEPVRIGAPFPPVLRVRLVRVLPIVGSVTVATGTEKNLHDVPLAVSVIDRSTIALAETTSVDRLLRALPGFDRTRSNSAFTNYGQLRASFSGAGNDRGAVLVDGVPAQDGFGGQIDWQAYPSDEVQRVELLRGAGSALYGSGAIGGALDIATFAPRTGAGLGVDGRLSLGAGTNDERHQSIQLRAPVGNRVGLSFSGVTSRLAYKDLPPAYASPIDDLASSTSGSAHLRARFDDGRTRIDASGIAASDHQSEGRPNYAFDRAFRQIDFVAARSIGAVAARVASYARDTTVDNLADIFPTKPGVPRYIQHVPTTENGLAASFQATSGTSDFALSLDGRRVAGTSQQVGPTGALQALGSGAETTRGIGVQATFRRGRAELLLGARGDAIHYENLALVNVAAATPAPIVKKTLVSSRDTGAISPRAALRYDISPAIALRASSGGGFRSPYLNELVRGFNVGAVVMAPNPNLVPERSRTDGLGLDALFDRDRGRFTFDLSQTHVTNAIAFATVSPTLMVRSNIARTQTNGETFTLAERVGACTRLRLSGTSQYARTTTAPGDQLGKRLAFVPEQSANLGIDTAGPGALAGSLDVSYVGQTFADDLERQPLGTALLVAATVRATTASGTSFSIAGENLTHQTYLSSIDRYGPPLGVSFRVGFPLGARPAAVAGRCAIE